ncbi:hypothetical protein ACD591_10175 [Rufibacter glacialis]|uniref:SMI1/KNR4 family protein n=1 Tax=Rufibacter glacialis TaxID=1259555 RepID=A0A5M8QAM3_9BACT|nr:hypothetical protein [Rufibacter glacialis]KAA6431866.1 hypothetical protein FOE74_17300 [Rufibacter glacialis]GGK80904.1 hypothetical protein GCM10011405_30800 [Rufibacter glacialis]
MNFSFKELEATLGFQLPADYAGFLRTFHGFEGQIVKEHVVLWDLGEPESANLGYAIQKNIPGSLGIG